jgi:hypothetical protein
VLTDAALLGDRNVNKKEAENVIKYKDFYNTNSAYVGCKNITDNGNNSGNWNHLKITHTVPEQTDRGSTKLRNCREQPYWALHRYCGKC